MLLHPQEMTKAQEIAGFLSWGLSSYW